MEIPQIQQIVPNVLEDDFHQKLPFDPAAPPVALPASVFCPFDSKHTLFITKALWAVYLPRFNQTFPDAAVIRSYWAQRLLWEIGGNIGFFLSSGKFLKLNESKTFENDNETISKLVDVLLKWTCPQILTFFECAIKLAKDISGRFWGDDEIESIELWLEDLVSVGYEEPKRVNHQVLIDKIYPHLNKDDQKLVESSHLTSQKILTIYNGTFVNFVPVKQNPQPGFKRTETSYEDEINTFCEKTTDFNSTRKSTVDKDLRYERNFYEDILLVVVFNHHEWFSRTLEFTEILHRKFFPNIVYCSDSCDQRCFSKLSKELKYEVTFLRAHIADGTYGHNCLSQAARMNYNVTGYLVTGDDDLINTWHLQNLDKTKPWFTERFIFNCIEGTSWGYWYYEKPKVLPLLEYLKEHYKDDQYRHMPILQKFFQRKTANLGQEDMCVRAVSDLYYIPRKYIQEIIVLFDFFSERKVFQEVAIPVTLYGVFDMKDSVYLNGTQCWAEDRKHVWDFYRQNDIYLHPMKFSYPENVDQLCKIHLPKLLAYYS